MYDMRYLHSHSTFLSYLASSLRRALFHSVANWGIVFLLSEPCTIERMPWFLVVQVAETGRKSFDAAAGTIDQDSKSVRDSPPKTTLDLVPTSGKTRGTAVSYLSLGKPPN